MAAADAPAVALGATDPATWGLAGWVSDIVPHLAYGFVIVLVYETLSQPVSARSHGATVTKLHTLRDIIVPRRAMRSVAER
jgi:hypothetical protein